MNYRVRVFERPDEFYSEARELLLRREAAYSRLAGPVSPSAQANSIKSDSVSPNLWLATVRDEHRTRGAAIDRFGIGLELSELASPMIDAVARELERVERCVVQVTAPSKTSNGFAERWARSRGAPVQHVMDQCAYRLDALQGVHGASGRSETAGPDDLALVRDWIVGFATDAGLPEVQRVRPERVPLLEAGRMRLWRVAGVPVAMAAWMRPTENGVAISLVYTPPEQRGKRYATALVADLSRELLAKGHSFCCLFADRNNPTSNQIYTRIGYRPVGEFSSFRFERADA